MSSSSRPEPRAKRRDLLSTISGVFEESPSASLGAPFGRFPFRFNGLGLNASAFCSIVTRNDQVGADRPPGGPESSSLSKGCRADRGDGLRRNLQGPGRRPPRRIARFRRLLGEEARAAHRPQPAHRRTGRGGVQARALLQDRQGPARPAEQGSRARRGPDAGRAAGDKKYARRTRGPRAQAAHEHVSASHARAAWRPAVQDDSRLSTPRCAMLAVA